MKKTINKFDGNLLIKNGVSECEVIHKFLKNHRPKDRMQHTTIIHHVYLEH